MDRLARRGRAAYRATVYDDPDFFDYFRAATPEGALASLNVGSRPAHRVRATRAWRRCAPSPGSSPGRRRACSRRPGWARCRPRVSAAGRRDDDPARDVSLVAVLPRHARPDGDGARQGRSADRFPVRRPAGAAALQPIGEHLRHRLLVAIDLVLDVTGHEVLVEDDSVLRRSIDVRNPYVDPINLVQVELLRRMRGGDARTGDALMITINGIAAGMRNTG